MCVLGIDNCRMTFRLAIVCEHSLRFDERRLAGLSIPGVIGIGRDAMIPG